MALRLGVAIGQARRIDCGYGVAVLVGPMSFAAFKEIEATAWRVARDRLPLDMAAETEAVEDADLRPEIEDAIRGAAAAQLLRLALIRFGRAWEGLELEDGTPAPMTADTVDQALELYPGVGQAIQASLLTPFQEVGREGNASAPSPATA